MEYPHPFPNRAVRAIGGHLPCLLLLFLSSLAAAGPSYTITDLGVLPGGVGAMAVAINNSGQIVGYADTGPATSLRPFLYQNGTMQNLGTFGGSPADLGKGLGINNQGQVVGFAGIGAASGEADAFIYHNGSMMDLGALPTAAPPFLGSAALAINSKGQAVGESGVSSTAFHAVLFDKGGVIDLGTLDSLPSGDSTATGINNRGQICGYAGAPAAAGQPFTTTSHAFLYEHGVMHDLGVLPGGIGVSEANGINNRGQIVGTSDYLAGHAHAVLWENGTIRDLGTLGGSDSGAYAINDAGDIVGAADTTTIHHAHAFVYTKGQMIDLGTLPGDTGSGAFGINNLGQIVGYSGTKHGTHAVLWTPNK